MGGEEERKKRVVVESLGWITESSIMPKKHRAIDGVGASSIMELKAELYKSQEESRKSKELSGSDVQFHRAKMKISAHDPFSLKNSGVEARARKDKLELKAEKDGSASYAALEKKAQLYEKLVRGELSDEEGEKYCVDFFRKGLEHGAELSEVNGSSEPFQPQDENRDGEDDTSLFGAKFVGPGRTAGAVDREQYKQFVREVHQEVNQAREKASELKLRRQEQAAARREKLRQAYLRKQLEKLKATSGSKEADA